MPHLQLKDLPAGTHEALRHRAALNGISMREYVLRLIEADLGRKATWDETMARVEAGSRTSHDPFDVVEILKAGREEREQRILAAVTLGQR